jgi:hypothetical protein
LTGSYSSAAIWLSVVATPAGGSKLGFVVHNAVGAYGKQHIFFGKTAAGYQLCYTYRDYNFESCATYSGGPVWSANVAQQLKLRIAKDATGRLLYTLYAGTYQFISYYLDAAWGSGDYGLDATGVAGFSNFIVSTSSSVKITIADCSISDAALTTIVANALGIPTTSVLGISRLGCAKRAVQATESVIISFIGTETLSSEDVANQFQTSYGTTSAPPGTGESILSVEPSSVSAVAEPAEIATFAAVGFLTAGAIAAIIAGSVVGAGAIATGTVLAVKKFGKKVQPTKEPEPKKEPEPEPKVSIQEPEPQPEKKKPKGVDIYNFNPNDPQSITQRSPPIKH